jgi:hypothetical protein
MQVGDTKQLKRLAVQVVAQLPEDSDDALRVLSYARELVISFLSDRKGAGESPVRPIR